MQPLERLIHLAQLGDRDAAEHLWTEALRRDDRALKITAAQALNDPARAGEVAATLWAEGDWARLGPFAQALGLVFTPSLADHLQRQLDEAHGARRVRLMTRAQLMAALFETRWGDTSSDASTTFTHAGTKKGGALGSPQTTACLAVYVPATHTLTVSIQSASATAPAAAALWPSELRPWSKEPSKNISKLVAWADSQKKRKQEDRIFLHTSPTAATSAPAPDVQSALEQLRHLLEAPPTAQSFKAIVSHLDKWPKAEKADLEPALHLTHQALNARWPDEARVITRLAFSRSLNHPDNPRPSDALYRHLELRDSQIVDIAQLASWHLSPNLTHLTLIIDNQAELSALSSVRDALSNVRILKLCYPHTWNRPRLTLDDFLSNPWPALEELNLDEFSLYIEATPGSPPPQALATIRKLTFPALLGDNIKERKRWEAPDPELQAFIQRAPLGALESLRLPEATTFTLLASCPQICNLRHLTLASGPSDPGLSLLANHPTLGLETINLERAEPPKTSTLRALLSGPTGRALRHFTLYISTHGPKGDAICAALAAAPSLTSLTIEPSYGATAKVTRKGLQDLLRDRPPGLRRLSLRLQSIESEGLLEIVNSPAASLIEVLDVFNNNLTSAAVVALAASPHMGHLRELTLSFNKDIDSDALRALAESAYLSNLATLSLDRCNITAAGVKALVESERLPALRVLTLAENPLGNESAVLFANAPGMSRLTRLHLYRTGIKKPGIQALEASPWLKGRFDGLPGYSSYIETPP